MKKKVLAISGKRFAGKDTFAAMLVSCAKERGVEMQIHAFARESKRMFVAAEAKAGVDVDLTRLQIDRDYKEQWRPRLTIFTVESIAADSLVFCKSVADRIEQENEATPLIADVRLRLEVEHLRSRFDLHLVRIDRSDAARVSAGWVYDASKDEHHTETELDDASLWNEVITNNGTHEELAAKAVTLLDQFISRAAT